MKILFAEDDKDISRAVVVLLQRNNFTVDAVYNGKDALYSLQYGNYDLAILDIMMPGMSGLDVLKSARSKGIEIPIMMLTAMGELDDKVTGLESGADDYLPKPFAGKELVARVRALLRRAESFTPSVIEYKDLKLDCSSFKLSCGNESVNLGNKGFQMMELFMKNPKMVISANQFMDRVWGWDSEAEINVVWVNISFLRKQLVKLGSCVTIEVMRGAGYILGGADA